MVVESVVVNRMPTAVEVVRQMDERVTAIQQGGLVFELLHPDACRGKPGKGCHLPSGLAVTAWERVRAGREKEPGWSETLQGSLSGWKNVRLPNPKSSSLLWILICLLRAVATESALLLPGKRVTPSPSDSRLFSETNIGLSQEQQMPSSYSVTSCLLLLHRVGC